MLNFSFKRFKGDQIDSILDMYCGAGNRNRTCDPLVTNQVLYLLSYASTMVSIVAKYFLILNIILLSKLDPPHRR